LKKIPDPEEAYAITGSGPFAHRNRAFYEGLANDLGYELDEARRRSGRVDLLAA